MRVESVLRRHSLSRLQESPTLQEFDALSEDPLLVFVDPPSLDPRIVNQFALFSLMSSAHGDLEVGVCSPRSRRPCHHRARVEMEIRDKLNQLGAASPAATVGRADHRFKPTPYSRFTAWYRLGQ
jgi:hypothetical protein